MVVSWVVVVVSLCGSTGLSRYSYDVILAVLPMDPVNRVGSDADPTVSVLASPLAYFWKTVTTAPVAPTMGANSLVVTTDSVTLALAVVP